MPRTKQQNEVIRNRRRDVIVNAAIRVFATLPYNEVTMSAIAREAKCGHSLIYHYFDNIRDLYDSAIEKIIPSFYPIMDFTKLPNQNPEIKFVGFVIYVMRLLKEDSMFPYYVQTFIHSANVGANLKSSGQTFIKHFLQQAIEMIKNGQKQGKIIDMDAEQIITNLSFTIRGICSSIIFEKKGVINIPEPSTLYLPFLRKE